MAGHKRSHSYDVDEETKRRKSGGESRANEIVYRYLCPSKKAGTIIGRGGETVRQLMAYTEAKILIGDSIPGCEYRVVTIVSSGDESDSSEEATGGYVCSAQDALVRVHERLVGSEGIGDGDIDMVESQAAARLLASSDQVGHIIGKGGETVHSIRNDTEANIQILKDKHLPLCASRSDELIQITGDASAVKKALLQVSSRLYKITSRIQNQQDDTVYRYLCEEKSVGSIIGKGGEIVEQLRADSQAKIIIGESIPGCKERVATIISSSERTNIFGDMSEHVCPAQDGLFRLHERLVGDGLPGDEDGDSGAPHVSVRLLVPFDHVGHIIGKGGHIIQDIRSNTEANIHIFKGRELPPCANRDDELLQITGQAPNVMKALVLVSSYLHGKPSRSQCRLPLYNSHPHLQNGSAAYRDKSSSKVFVLSLLCPSANISRVIGKGGNIINKIRQQSGAIIKVDSSTEEDCIIAISEKESSEDLVSSTIYAAVRLQPICSEMTETRYGEPLYITRLIIPTSQIGCLIGKGGSVINDMRRATQANIRIMPKESLSKAAPEDSVIVQISGELAAARNALTQISTRLKAKTFGQESALPHNIEYVGTQFDP